MTHSLSTQPRRLHDKAPRKGIWVKSGSLLWGISLIHLISPSFSFCVHKGEIIVRTSWGNILTSTRDHACIVPAWGRYSVQLVIVIPRTKWTCILKILSSIPHSCKVIHKCVPFAPLPSLLECQLPRGLLPHYRGQVLQTSLNPRKMCLSLFHTTWLQGWVWNPAQGHQLTTATNGPQKAPGTWDSDKIKAREREGIHTHTTKEVLSCLGQMLLFAQRRAQSSLRCGPPQPWGHPLTAFPGPGPEVLIKCKKKKLSSSPLAKEQVLVLFFRANPLEMPNLVLHHKVLLSWQKSSDEKGPSWREKKSRLGKSAGLQPPPQSGSIFGFLKVNLTV